MAERAANGAHSTVQLQMREMPEACGIMTRDEAYELVVLAEGVTITAETPAGVFYGIQSLLQLLPWSTEASCRVPVLKGCRILDYPRFKWCVYTLSYTRRATPVPSDALSLCTLHHILNMAQSSRRHVSERSTMLFSGVACCWTRAGTYSL